jgi:hypothetical protein
MRPTEVVIGMRQGQLLAQARLVVAPRHDAPPDGRHLLADRPVDALAEGRGDLAAGLAQHRRDAGQGAEDAPVAHAYQPPAPILFRHLRLAQGGRRHPARLGHRTCGLAPRSRPPLTDMR